MRCGIYRGCADLDIVILPVGGGGLISGMAAAIKRQRPDITIIGVEPVGADSLSRSFRSVRRRCWTRWKQLRTALVP